MDRIFVYGTLMNLSFLDLCFSVIPREVADATLPGMLFDIDTFPVLIEPEHPGPDDVVHGKLLTIPDLEKEPALFDRYMDVHKKNPPFTREVRTVLRHDGKRVEAYVFVGNPRNATIRNGISNENRVPDGRWVEPL